MKRLIICFLFFCSNCNASVATPLEVTEDALKDDSCPIKSVEIDTDSLHENNDNYYKLTICAEIPKKIKERYTILNKNTLTLGIYVTDTKTSSDLFILETKNSIKFSFLVKRNELRNIYILASLYDSSANTSRSATEIEVYTGEEPRVWALYCEYSELINERLLDLQKKQSIEKDLEESIQNKEIKNEEAEEIIKKLKELKELI